MKNFIFAFIFLVVFSAPARSGEPVPRGMFVSLVQSPPTLSNRTEIRRLVNFAKQARVKILFVQVYRSDQAWFPSRIADASPYERCRKSVGEDPLALLIRTAHREQIAVHAWLNLLSLGTNTDARFLQKYGPEILTRNLKGKKQLKDYKIDGQYFLEPGDLRVRQELSAIVGEILTAYPDLDGIQFDYIRYPDANPHYGYTKTNMERFKHTTGLRQIDEEGSAWKDWRRAQVTELLAALVQKARGLRPGIQVSATGCLPYVRAYHEAYQDWPSWIKSGLVDFVTLMDYSPDPSEFDKWIKTAKTKTADFKKVNIGVGAYKLVKSPEIFEQEFRGCEQKQDPGMCVVFHYGSVLESPKMKNFLAGSGPAGQESRP